MESVAVDGDQFENNLVQVVPHVNSYRNRPHFC
jgi:hypothetical protein